MDVIFEVIEIEIAEEEHTTGTTMDPILEGLGNECASLYADDTLLLAKEGPAMNGLLENVERFSGAFGLKLNRNKCVVIRNKEGPQEYCSQAGKE